MNDLKKKIKRYKAISKKLYVLKAEIVIDIITYLSELYGQKIEIAEILYLNNSIKLVADKGTLKITNMDEFTRIADKKYLDRINKKGLNSKIAAELWIDPFDNKLEFFDHIVTDTFKRIVQLTKDWRTRQP